MIMRRKIAIGVSGASGSIYTKVLFDKLLTIKDQWESVAVVLSVNAKSVWKVELEQGNLEDYPFDYYSKQDFNSPIASGSAQYDSLVIIPCSMGTLGRIASGVSDDLLTRAADVMLKERRKLILVPRETPLNKIHLENMLRITEAGGIICPAMPSFYSSPSNFEELASTVVDRVLNLLSFEVESYKWGN